MSAAYKEQYLWCLSCFLSRSRSLSRSLAGLLPRWLSWKMTTNGFSNQHNMLMVQWLQIWIEKLFTFSRPLGSSISIGCSSSLSSSSSSKSSSSALLLGSRVPDASRTHLFEESTKAHTWDEIEFQEVFVIYEHANTKCHKQNDFNASVGSLKLRLCWLEDSLSWVVST